MKVISQEDLFVASLNGHTAQLKANEPKELNEDVALAAIALGATPFKEEVKIEAPVVEDEGDDLIDVLTRLIELGNPDDFKADGTPKASVVNKAIGRTVRTEEREAAWERALNL